MAQRYKQLIRNINATESRLIHQRKALHQDYCSLKKRTNPLFVLLSGSLGGFLMGAIFFKKSIRFPTLLKQLTLATLTLLDVYKYSYIILRRFFPPQQGVKL